MFDIRLARTAEGRGGEGGLVPNEPDVRLFGHQSNTDWPVLSSAAPCWRKISVAVRVASLTAVFYPEKSGDEVNLQIFSFRVESRFVNRDVESIRKLKSCFFNEKKKKKRLNTQETKSELI